MVDALVADRGVPDVRGRRAEVAAVQVPEGALRADVRRFVCAVARVDRLWALEEEEARSGAYI